MRGAFVRILHGASQDNVRSVFGVSVSSFDQCNDHVGVTFADESHARFDLLVGADGQNSRMRRMMLGTDNKDPIQPTGQVVAYFTTSHEILRPEIFGPKASLQPISDIFWPGALIQ